MRKILFFLTLTASLFGIEKSIDIINDKNIFFIKSDNLKKAEGKYNYKFGWQVYEKENFFDDNIDLLIHFNENGEVPFGNYKIVKGEITACPKTYFLGKGAGDFKGENNCISLEPYTNSIFAPDNDIDNFYIDFYLYTTVVEGDEIIFSLNNALTKNNKIIYQLLNCEIDDNKILFKIRNFFIDENLNTTEFVLKGKTKIEDRKWNRHTLNYSKETGAIEYYINGMLEDIKYATEDRSENSLPLMGITGKNYKSGIKIGKKLYGKIDEFVIGKDLLNKNLQLSKYKNNNGSIITNSYDLGNSSSSLIKLTPIVDTPKNSEVNIYYRITENRIEKIYWDEMDYYQNKIKWIPYNEKIGIENLKGRYIQFKIDLLTDDHNNASPILYAINLSYNKNLPPLAPLNLVATPLNGAVKLSWVIASSMNVRGFKIYYGEAPGIYSDFKTIDLESQNSLKYSYVLDNLENDKLYYISVKSFDNSKNNQFSDFSEEITIRTGEKHGF